jgi:ATP adenylyltransferase
LATDTNAPSEKLLKLAPGSDINVHGFEIQQLGETHRLTFNMYCTYRPQYLLLTLDGFRRQWEPLDIDDFTAAYTLLTSLNDEYIIFYNCKEEAGCSRLHKHLQAIPKDSFDPWQNLNKNVKDVPFTYFSKSYGPQLPSPEELHKTYTGFIQEADRLLNSPCTKPNEAPAHNMILDKRGMVVIPRRCVGIEDVGANACGMLGMIWVSHDYMMKEWMAVGPRKVLTAAGVPSNKT